MKKLILSSLASLSLLTACGVTTDFDQQTADRIARPAFMVERDITAGKFEIASWERMHKRNQPATIYIEGDSFEPRIMSADTTSPVPISSTPTNPVGLSLASRDLSTNLAYLSRPCQYVKMAEKKGCDARYWTEDRYAPEVIEAYQLALNDIAARYSISEFHIVGYGGGANIAAVLAATRKDIETLRTVAGDLNPRFNDNVVIPAVSDSAVLAIDYGTTLAKIPQHHFIGAADDIVTPGTYHSYRQAIGLSECIHYSLIQDADHHAGWVDKWPQLLAVHPKCTMTYDPQEPANDGIDFNDHYKGGKGFKK